MGKKTELRIDLKNRIRSYKCFYENFFFEKWMSSRIIEGDISYQAKNFIMRRFWSEGTIAAYNINDYDKMTLGFAPYAPFTFDMYDYPIDLRLINRRGVSEKLIPNEVMHINKNVVIGFCNKSHKPIKFFIDKWVDKIIQIEVLMDNNIGLQNIPFLIKNNGNNESKIDSILTRILSGEIVINVDGAVMDDIELLDTKIQYLADKFFDLKDRYINEALTYLGINNNPMEKKERQIVDEVNSNNQEIEENDDAINDELDDFSLLIKKVLGKDLIFISKFDLISDIASNNQEEEKEENKEE